MKNLEGYPILCHDRDTFANAAPVYKEELAASSFPEKMSYTWWTWHNITWVVAWENDPSGEKFFLVENVERQKWLLWRERNVANPCAPFFRWPFSTPWFSTKKSFFTRRVVFSCNDSWCTWFNLLSQRAWQQMLVGDSCTCAKKNIPQNPN